MEYYETFWRCIFVCVVRYYHYVYGDSSRSDFRKAIHHQILIQYLMNLDLTHRYRMLICIEECLDVIFRIHVHQIGVWEMCASVRCLRKLCHSGLYNPLLPQQDRQGTLSYQCMPTKGSG